MSGAIIGVALAAMVGVSAHLVGYDRDRSFYAVAHRANRAVIFASSLFHKTDECSFRQGYLNKRINVSSLYGDWPGTQA